MGFQSLTHWSNASLKKDLVSTLLQDVVNYMSRFALRILKKISQNAQSLRVTQLLLIKKPLLRNQAKPASQNHQTSITDFSVKVSQWMTIYPSRSKKERLDQELIQKKEQRFSLKN